MKIFIYNTYISIIPYKLGDSKTIEKALSVWDKGTFSYSMSFYKYNEENEELRIPSAFPFYLIKREIADKNNAEVIDCRTNVYKKDINSTIEMKYSPRNNIQVKAIDFLNNNKDISQKFLSLNTGDGKTFCSLYFVFRRKLKPIIFVSSNKLIEQWKEKAIEYSDIKEEEIYIISGKKSVEKIISMDNNEGDNYRLIIASHKTIISQMEKMQLILEKLKVSIKIFDEAHLDMENIFKINVSTDYPTLYLTATPSRSNQEENHVYQNMYKEIVKFKSDNRSIVERKEKYHNAFIFKFNSNPSEEFIADFKKKSRTRGFNIPMYTSYIMEYNYDIYLSMIYKLIHDIIFNNGNTIRKTVILVKSIDLLESLKADIEEKLEDDKIDISVSRFHSKVPKKEKEASLDSNLIFSTDSSLSTAIDIPNLEVVLSLIPTSSEVLTTQMLGRLRYIEGKEVYYFDLVDKGFKECVNQLYKRKKNVYLKRCKVVKEVNV